MATDIVFDCDPGHDDAIALFLAVGSDAIDIQAVTTVAGNHTLENTTRNARQLLTLIDQPNIPVGRGMAQPLVRNLTIAPEVHGETGLDGPDMPPPAIELDDRHGVDLLIETIKANDGITLVPVGPLTNVGAALRKDPSIVDGIDGIVLMGGAVTEGNKTPAAEFNIYVDPEAARHVFESGLPITMVNLDVTHESRVAPDEVDQFRSMDNDVGPVVADLLDFAGQYYRDTYGFAGYPIHDAVAVAQVIDEDTIETEHMRVDVETRGEFTAGRTVCDVVGVVEDREPNADVGTGLDRDAFMSRLLDVIEQY